MCRTPRSLLSCPRPGMMPCQPCNTSEAPRTPEPPRRLRTDSSEVCRTPRSLGSVAGLASCPRPSRQHAPAWEQQARGPCSPRLRQIHFAKGIAKEILRRIGERYCDIYIYIERGRERERPSVRDSRPSPHSLPSTPPHPLYTFPVPAFCLLAG